MIKRTIIIPAFILLFLFPAAAQEKKQQTGPKREVTLYNPYKPSLAESKKRSFLPIMNDSLKVNPVFKYDIKTEPFLPSYTISTIRAASLLPDPLPKLYKSYLNIGMGNYISPLGEISITNERSKKGALGFYARHFSSNGKVELQNSEKVFAGYMDNDASLFGKRFFRKTLLESSVDFSQKVRYAYGYDPVITDYSPGKSDIRMRYNNIGAKASMSSLTLDSSSLSYDFDLYYNFFHNAKNLYQHNIGIEGIMSKSYKGFYMGSGISYVLYKPADSLSLSSDFIFSLNPFIKKASEQWSFKLGVQALIDRFNNLHIYPDIDFGFNVVPSYIRFFTGLSGKLERNEPFKIISENPYLESNQFPGFVPNGFLFRLPDTDHKLIISAGLKGNTGLNGNYLVSASYSLIDNMLFYSNLVFPDTLSPRAIGNYFIPLSESGDLLNIHAEMNGAITDKLNFYWTADYYNYDIVGYAWNRPDWDGKVGLKYNLRNKIIAGMEFTAIGKRMQIVNGDLLSMQSGHTSTVIEMPSHFNLNLSAEYRYSKILSIWTKFNNISTNRYYEWAYYPSQRFQFMLGFTYSL